MGWNFSLKMPIFAGEHGKEKPQRNASSGRFIARAHTAGITVHYGWLMKVGMLRMSISDDNRRQPSAFFPQVWYSETNKSANSATGTDFGTPASF